MSPPLRRDYDMMIHEIGSRDELTRKRAIEAAGYFALAVRAYPNATQNIVIGGFDADPRELWDIPEAREYVRLFASRARGNIGRPFVEWKLADNSITVLAMCTGAGKIIGVNPETGAFLVDVDLDLT